MSSSRPAAAKSAPHRRPARHPAPCPGAVPGGSRPAGIHQHQLHRLERRRPPGHVAHGNHQGPPGRPPGLAGRRFAVNAGTFRQLMRWCGQWPERRFAIEGARGLGRTLAQQLAAVGENVVDVPSTLSARARLPATGGDRRTDADDARHVAQVALFRHDLRPPSPRTGPPSCGCRPNDTRTWSTNAPASSTGCTPSCATCCPEPACPPTGPLPP